MSPSAKSRSLSRPYGYRLLRYAPAALSEEFYNLAVMLLDGEGRILDARFAPDLRRMQCNPAVEMEFLNRFKAEFEERLLMGEGFSEYVAELSRNLSNSLMLSDEKRFFGGEPAVEIERLAAAYVATPRPLSEDRERSPAAGSRAALRRRLDQAFEAYRLFGEGRGVERGRRVVYGDGGLEFTFDYGYERAGGGSRLIHALSRRGEMNEASRLCLVYDRLRGGESNGADLTAVYGEPPANETAALLRSSRIESWDVAKADELAERARVELGW